MGDPTIYFKLRKKEGGLQESPKTPAEKIPKLRQRKTANTSREGNGQSNHRQKTPPQPFPLAQTLRGRNPPNYYVQKPIFGKERLSKNSQNRIQKDSAQPRKSKRDEPSKGHQLYPTPKDPSTHWASVKIKENPKKEEKTLFSQEFCFENLGTSSQRQYDQKNSMKRSHISRTPSERIEQTRRKEELHLATERLPEAH